MALVPSGINLGGAGTFLGPMAINAVKAIGIMLICIVPLIIIYFFRDKIGIGRARYNTKVTIYQPRMDGWKKFYTKGAFLTDIKTGLEYFKIKGRKHIQKPPVLSRLTKGNEVEYIETEVCELYPLYTTIAKEPIQYEVEKEVEYEENGEKKKRMEKQIVTDWQYKKVLDPDITETRAFQAMFQLESNRQFGITDWVTKWGQTAGTFGLLICLTVIVLIIWYTFSHPIVLQVAGTTAANVVSGG